MLNPGKGFLLAERREREGRVEEKQKRKKKKKKITFAF